MSPSSRLSKSGLQSVEKDELSMLARLSVFAGSFNAEGAAAVGKAPSQVLPRRIAVMLEDMRSCAVLEAALPACSAPCSQPAASQPGASGLLAPRYNIHSLISRGFTRSPEGASGIRHAGRPDSFC